jgi:hypothetical protein
MKRFGGYDVFISYRSLDAHSAREIADQLIASGIRVWFAEYQILLTNWDQFEEALLEGIRRSAFGLAITNDRYAESEHCRLEMAKLIERIGPGRVLEVRLPDEDETRRVFPALSSSPHSAPRDTGEILSFVQEQTGWKILPLVEIDTSAMPRKVEGICLDEHFALNVTGWNVIDPGGYRHPDETVDGPVLEYVGGRYPLRANVFAGLELAEEARPQTRSLDNREMYRVLMEYLPRHLGRWDADLRGLHLLFHAGLSQMAVTYTTRGYWTRKHSVVLPHPSGEGAAEFVFTFGFFGPFKEYCRHARLMDGLVTTLEWGDEAGTPGRTGTAIERIPT